VEDIFNLPFNAEAKVGKSYGTLQKIKVTADISAIDWKRYTEDKVTNTILEVA
jgi:hypothetical protein